MRERAGWGAWWYGRKEATSLGGCLSRGRARLGFWPYRDLPTGISGEVGWGCNLRGKSEGWACIS